MRGLPRRTFLRLFGAACAYGASQGLRPLSVRAADQPPVRVLLFGGTPIVQASVNGYVLTPRSVTERLSGPQAVLAIRGAPLLDLAVTTAAGDTLERRYPGTLLVQADGSSLTFVNIVDVETYVAAVLSAEVSASWAKEALLAQAIAIRTFAARAQAGSGTRAYDVVDGTASQVYPGIRGSDDVFTGVAQATAGQMLTFGGAPAAVFYSSCCGGHTASLEELTGRPSPPYLLGIADGTAGEAAYCSASPYYRWSNMLPADALARAVGMPDGRLDSLTVSERWPDGRVKTVVASGPATSVRLDGRTFYSHALDVLGYKVIPSTLFDVTKVGFDFQISGRGVGHGVGMCQWGARGRADDGMNAQQILAAYFPGTTLTDPG
jgi:stage II sporulation protein D